MFHLLGRLGAIGIVLALLVWLVLFPWVVIWALNTLFPVLAIQYNFWTWLAVVIIGTYFKTEVTVKK